MTPLLRQILLGIASLFAVAIIILGIVKDSPPRIWVGCIMLAYYAMYYMMSRKWK